MWRRIQSCESVSLIQTTDASMYNNILFYTFLRLALKQRQAGLEATPLNWFEPDFVLLFASWWHQDTCVAIKVLIKVFLNPRYDCILRNSFLLFTKSPKFGVAEHIIPALAPEFPTVLFSRVDVVWLPWQPVLPAHRLLTTPQPAFLLVETW